MHYTYHDDGLLIPSLDPSQAAEYERGILSLSTRFAFTPNMCTPGMACNLLGRLEFTSPPFVLGSNDMPDDISGEVTLVARYSLTSAFYPFGPSAAGGYLSVSIDGVRAQAISAPVPEPGSYALMLAGLAFLSLIAAKRRASSQRGGSRQGLRTAGWHVGAKG